MSLPVKEIAVIGSGISGLMSAYLLSNRHTVTVFEAATEIGGHTATKKVVVNNEDYAVDTGFIVFNDRTYPNFLKLLSKLGVSYQPTDMGFSVSCRKTGFEYAGTSLNGVFAQRRNLLSVRHWKMLADILRFNKECIALHEKNVIPVNKTLGEYLEAGDYSDAFRHFYILPMVSAIWSSSLEMAANMPLVFFIRFFYNHGLLTVSSQPQWYTLIGGSHQYLQPLTARFKDNILVNCPVRSVRRVAEKVVLITDQLGAQEFDEVIFACHSDQALALLADPSSTETEILSAIPYEYNKVVLHSDTRLLPKSSRAWASWNYLLPESGASAATLTYNMNILQRFTSGPTFCVSVNAGEEIDREKIYGSYCYSHPMFTLESLAAQARWSEISGVNHTHFCGAYWRNGFHEDGVVSAIKVAEALGEHW